MSRYVHVELHKLNINRISIRRATRVIDEVTKEALALAQLASRGPYSTGRTAASMVREIHVRGRTVHGEVRARTPHAEMAHDGTRPHVIRPRNPGGKLRFFWRKVGHTVTFDYVNHPGMKGKHFLSGPMEIVGRRHRFVVITYV